MPSKEFAGGAEGTKLIRTLDGHLSLDEYRTGVKDREELYHEIDARRNVHDATEY